MSYNCRAVAEVCKKIVTAPQCTNLVRGFVPVGRDLLHNELHHPPGAVSGLLDKTTEASAMFQQHAAAFSQHLVGKI